jgi:tetratricopeptide (TPR) repeat protein
MVGFACAIRARFFSTVALIATGATLSCVPTDETVWIGFSSSDRYLARATQQGRLVIHDLEKRKSCEITTKAAAAGGFEWSPVGDRLVFCARQRGVWNLALADPAGTITLLSRDEWRDLQPAWSPDGRGIYYVSSFGGGYHGDYDIRYYDLATRQGYPVIRGPHDQVEPHISPDGRWLAAISYQHGNPMLLIYALKTTRAIQISPPPGFRGAHLRLLLWLSDSRRLLYEIEQSGRFHLVECEVESEKSVIRDSSDQPFESATLDRQGRDVLYVTGGKVYRRSTQSGLGRKQRLAFQDLSISQLAVRHRDDRLGAVAEGRLLALASAAGDKVEPLLGDVENFLEWGDLELQRGRKKQGLAHYAAALRRVRERGGAETGVEVARVKLSRAPLLCGLGYSRETSDYLREAQRALEKTMDEKERAHLYLLLSLNEYVWNNRPEAARALIEKIALTKESSDDSTAAAFLRKVLDHPDKQVREEIRRGLAALWRGKTEEWMNIFQRLLKAHPADPVVQAAYRAIHGEQVGLPLMGVFAFPSAKNVERLVTATARLLVRYPEIVGKRFQMNSEWFDSLWESFTILHDADGLKRLILRDGPQFLNREKVAGFYHRYWKMENRGEEDDPALNAVLTRVLLDGEVLAVVDKKITDPKEQTDVRLARARYALVGGDYDEMKSVLAELGKELDQVGADLIFGSDRLGEVAHVILQGELDERLNAWDKAVRHYRDATARIETLIKEGKKDPHTTEYLSHLLHETRFRADLLEGAPAVRDELADLLAIERGVGDLLMTDSTDPTSLLNGIHNYFAVLGRMNTPWLKDLVYLKAGQSYRRLGRWCEAAFCLRVAAQSRERFVGRCARAELGELYRDLEDPGLAAF